MRGRGDRMKKTDAIPCDGIVCDCPYCGKEVVELNGDLRDVTYNDIESETEIACPFCSKIFLAVIEEY